MASKKQSKKKNSNNPSGTNKFMGSKILILALIIITYISFSPILDNEFLNFDDYDFIVENGIVNGNIEGSQFSAALQDRLWTPYYKPMVYFTWILEYQIFGMDPKVFHFTNLVIHILNSILVFFIIQIILNKVESPKTSIINISILTALLFAVHPLKVESVAWAIERKDVLFSFYYLIGIWAYLKYLIDKNFRWMGIVAVCYLFSCLSKSHGITLIGVLFLFDYLWNREWNKNIFIEKWPVFLSLIAVITLFGFIGGDSSNIIASSNTEKVVTEALVFDPPNIASLPNFYKVFLQMNYRFWLFLVHFLIPIKLALVYPSFKIVNAVGQAIHLFPLLSLGLVYSLFRLLKKSPAIVFGILFFAVTLSPVLVLLGKGSNFLSDRYTYISSLSILFLISYLLLKYAGEKRSQVVLLGVIVVYSFSTYSRSSVWENDAIIWEDNLSKYGDDTFPLNALGRYYAKEANNPQKAIAYLDKSLAYAPNNSEALLLRGNVNGMLGKVNESVDDFTKALELNPNSFDATTGLSIGYAQLGKNDLAQQYFEKSVELDPTNIVTLRNLGEFYSNTGKYPESIEILSKVLVLDKSNSRASYYIAISYFNQSDYTSAESYINSAIKQNPLGEYYLLKSKIFYRKGNTQEAKKLVEYLLGQRYPVGDAYRNLFGL